MKSPQPPHHVSYDINIHDVYTSRNIDHLRKFLFHHHSKRVASDRHVNNNSGAVISGLSYRLSKSPSGGTSPLTNHTIPCVASADLNRRDLLGRTLLHRLAASEDESESLSWLKVLADHPQLQINATDTENGWTALHRAFFSGNLRFAKALIDDMGCEIDIRDYEGMSPFALYNSTIDGACPTQFNAEQNRTDLYTWGNNRNFVLGTQGAGDRLHPEKIHLKHQPRSNQPISSSNSVHFNQFSSASISSVAMSRLHTAVVTTTGELWVCGFGSGGRLGLGWSTNNHTPANHLANNNVIAQTQLTFARVKGVLIGQKVKMVALGQDHTVVVTESGHVYTFGMNRFGQLGYGAEVSTLDPSELLTAPNANQSNEFIQADPKRVVGPLKKEIVLGATASRWHTAIFTADSLYTWGAHQGQLGYHNSSPSSQNTSIQSSPRKATAASAPILQLTCTDYITAYLCRNSEVYILRSNTCVKVSFPADRFPLNMSIYRPRGKSGIGHFHITKISAFGDTFAAVSNMGDVFALDLERGFQSEATSTTLLHLTSTNTYHSAPTQAFSSATGSQIFRPQRVWTLGKKFTAATDVAVGMDGSIVFCTKSGHVFVLARRVETHTLMNKGFTARSGETNCSKAFKNYKPTRVAHLERVIRVASNPTGAFSAIREDATLNKIRISSPAECRSLPSTLVCLLSHLKNCAGSTPELYTVPPYQLSNKVDDTYTLNSKDEDVDEEEDGMANTDHESGQDEGDRTFDWDVRVGCALFRMSVYWDNEQALDLPRYNGDVIILAENKPILAHKFILCSRTDVLSQIVSGHLTHADIVYHPACSKSVDCNGTPRTIKLPALEFRNFSLVSLLLFVHYLYTDHYPCIWDLRVLRILEKDHQEVLQDRLDPAGTSVASELQKTKLELKRLAQITHLEALEKSLGKMGKVVPEPCLTSDFEAQLELSGSQHQLSTAEPHLAPDIELTLKDGEVVGCHSILMRAQCPFFQMMFEEDAWVVSRRETSGVASRELIRIDMSHFSKRAMEVVIRHIYTDGSTELFSIEGFECLDDYVDFVVNVMAIANELLMDKLKWICSVALRDCLNLNNVTSITAEAEFYKADALKQTCMNYMLCNLETIFQDKTLIDIPSELLMHISQYLKRLQELKFPQARSQRFKQDLLDTNASFLSELDLPNSKIGMTPRHWKQFIKFVGSSSQLSNHNTSDLYSIKPVLADLELKNGAVPIRSSSAIISPDQYSGSPTSIGPSSFGTSIPKTSRLSPAPPVAQPSPEFASTQARRVGDDQDLDEGPFMMDELDHMLPETESSIKVEDSRSVRQSAWANTATQRPRTDLRSIMSAEKPRATPSSLASAYGSIPPAKLPSGRTAFESPTSGKLSQREKRRISFETSKAPIEPSTVKAPAWKPTPISNTRLTETVKDQHTLNPLVKGAASTHSTIKPIRSSSGGNGGMLQESIRDSAEETSPLKRRPAIGSGLPISFTVPISGSQPASTSTLNRPSESVDPASAVGAVVITPARLSTVTGTPSFRSHRFLGGQDTAWTNYASTSSTSFYTSGLPGSPPDDSSQIGLHQIGQPSTTDTSKAFDKSNKPKFSVIQYQQENESLAIKNSGKNKPSLLKIQEEENLRQQERKQEEEFLKWFEEESRKHQQQIPQAAGPSSKNGTKNNSKKSSGHKSSKAKLALDLNVQSTAVRASTKSAGTEVPSVVLRNSTQGAETRDSTPVVGSEERSRATSGPRRAKPKPKKDTSGNSAVNSSSSPKTCPQQVAGLNVPLVIRGSSQVKSK